MMLCFQVFDNILLAQEKVSESKISAMNLMEVHKNKKINNKFQCSRSKYVTIFLLRLRNFNCQAVGSVLYKILCLVNILCGMNWCVLWVKQSGIVMQISHRIYQDFKISCWQSHKMLCFQICGPRPKTNIYIQTQTHQSVARKDVG